MIAAAKARECGVGDAVGEFARGFKRNVRIPVAPNNRSGATDLIESGRKLGYPRYVVMGNGSPSARGVSCEFESLSYAEALKIADEGETWVVENFIGSATTLLYGEAKSGKSFLVSALIKSLATGTDFLRKPVPQDRAFSNSRTPLLG